MLSATQKIGTKAEDSALSYLSEQGLKLVKRNFRCRQGEIDLIMRDGNYYVFVEVRYRKSPSHGDSLESITSNKQAKVTKAATVYLLQQDLYAQVLCRFDVVSLTAPQNNIIWIKDAFQVQ